MGVKFYTNIIPSHMWWECKNSTIWCVCPGGNLQLASDVGTDVVLA